MLLEIFFCHFEGFSFNFLSSPYAVGGPKSLISRRGSYLSLKLLIEILRFAQYDEIWKKGIKTHTSFWGIYKRCLNIAIQIHPKNPLQILIKLTLILLWREIKNENLIKIFWLGYKFSSRLWLHTVFEHIPSIFIKLFLILFLVLQ